MPFIGNKPSAVPLTSADIADGIITSAKIVDATIANADIANSTIDLTAKVTGTLPTTKGGTGLAAIGSSLQVLRTNTGATALEFATLSTGAAAGQIIQVVSATDTTKRTTTSTSFVVASNTLTGVITPSSASNKIIVAVMACHAYTAEQFFLGSVYRTISGTTVNLANDTSDSGGGFAFLYDRKVNCIILLYDSPNTTSEITYQFRFRTDNASYPAEFGESETTNSRSIILCMEVKQ
jgi:hypothetical protein